MNKLTRTPRSTAQLNIIVIVFVMFALLKFYNVAPPIWWLLSFVSIMPLGRVSCRRIFNQRFVILASELF